MIKKNLKKLKFDETWTRWEYRSNDKDDHLLEVLDLNQVLSLILKELKK